MKVPLIDLYARFLFFMRYSLSHSVIPRVLFSVIPSVAEESRGNVPFFFPAAGFSSVIPSVAEESRGNERGGLFLILFPLTQKNGYAQPAQPFY